MPIPSLATTPKLKDPNTKPRQIEHVLDKITQS